MDAISGSWRRWGSPDRGIPSQSYVPLNNGEYLTIR
jgi:hypothetical protein